MNTYLSNNNQQSRPRPIIRQIAIMIVTVLAVFSLTAHATQTSPAKITGKLVNSKTNSAISLHTVYIADLSMLSFNNAKLSASEKFRLSIAHSKKLGCEAPKLPHVSYTCTNLQGEFALPVLALNSDSFHLAIAGQRGTLRVNITSQITNVGNISFIETASRQNKIAIISLAANPFLSKPNSLGHKVNTSSEDAVSYLFDSEILSGYGIEFTSSNVEYYRSFRSDTDGKTLLDTNRFSTVLVKGSWEDILALHGEAAVARMLKFVENGGELLIKDNQKHSNITSTIDQYI